MEHDIPFGNSNRENGTTFLDFPLFLGIFQWDEPTKRVPFTAEPEIPEILTKWKAPLDSTLWIPDCSTVKIGFPIPIASKILYSLSWITDSKARESEFHEQKFPGSRIPQAKISQIVESGLP